MNGQERVLTVQTAGKWGLAQAALSCTPRGGPSSLPIVGLLLTSSFSLGLGFPSALHPVAGRPGTGWEAAQVLRKGQSDPRDLLHPCQPLPVQALGTGPADRSRQGLSQSREREEPLLSATLEMLVLATDDQEASDRAQLGALASLWASVLSGVMAA